MQDRRRASVIARTAIAGAALALVGFVAACADSSTAPANALKVSANPDIVSIADDPALQGVVILCKETVGGVGGESFSFTVSINGGAAAPVEVTEGTCTTVSSSTSENRTVVITELGETDWDLTNIEVQRMRGFVFADAEDEATGVATVFSTNDAGRRVVFTNTLNPPPPPPGEEGCTPGYWKNHTSSWEGYTTGQTLSSVFTGTSPYGSTTLLDALSFGGGPGVDGAKRILLRAAVAALLNASSTGVDYTMTEQEVIDAVNAALATNDRETILELAADLDADNNLGCPLN